MIVILFEIRIRFLKHDFHYLDPSFWPGQKTVSLVRVRKDFGSEIGEYPGLEVIRDSALRLYEIRFC